jgi:hypothetical protein
MNNYNIWIEAEHWAEGEWDSYDCNSDVIVSFESTAKWVATFFTYENIKTLAKRHAENGDCLNGKYFWATEMILVDELTRKRVEEVVAQLLVDDELERVFSRRGEASAA